MGARPVSVEALTTCRFVLEVTAIADMKPILVLSRPGSSTQPGLGMARPLSGHQLTQPLHVACRRLPLTLLPTTSRMIVKVSLAAASGGKAVSATLLTNFVMS